MAIADANNDAFIDIDGSTRVPRSELVFRAIRSGGPGGQHVNTSSTKVELTWNIGATSSLTDEQKARVNERLRSRIDAQGELRLTSSRTRSQTRNKEDVTDRFRRILGAALKEEKPRRKTRPPRAAAEARLEEKRRRAQIKSRRAPPQEHD